MSRRPGRQVWRRGSPEIQSAPASPEPGERERDRESGIDRCRASEIDGAETSTTRTEAWRGAAQRSAPSNTRPLDPGPPLQPADSQATRLRRARRRPRPARPDHSPGSETCTQNWRLHNAERRDPSGASDNTRQTTRGGDSGPLHVTEIYRLTRVPSRARGDGIPRG